MLMFRVMLVDMLDERSVTVKDYLLTEEDAVAYVEKLPDPKDNMFYEIEEYNEIG